MEFRVLDQFMLEQLAAAPLRCSCPLAREAICDVNRCPQCWRCMEELLTWANLTLYGARGQTISKKALRQDIRWNSIVWTTIRRGLMPPPPVAMELPTCSICLDVYIDGAILVCGHGFHAECVSRWLHRSRTCPVCRTVQPL